MLRGSLLVVLVCKVVIQLGAGVGIVVVFAVLSYGWEELILQVLFWHCLQVGDSNLPYNCCVFFDFAKNSGVQFWGCYIMVSEPKFEHSTLRALHMCSKSMRFVYE